MAAIYKRELKAYFSNMIGYLFIAFTVLIVGLFFCYNNLGSYGWPYFGAILGSVSFVMMLTIPVLTMRSFSDDRHSKADQLLLTAPVTVAEITLGKYLAMVTVLAIPMVIFCACPLIIGSVGKAYYLTDCLLYTSAGDIGFFRCEGAADCILGPGRFIVLESMELHEPCAPAPGCGKALKKAVFKIAAD